MRTATRATVCPSLVAMTLLLAACAPTLTTVPPASPPPKSIAHTSPDPALRPTANPTITATPDASQVVMTQEEAGRQTLLLLDPARQPRVEWERSLPARAISQVWGTASIATFGEGRGTDPGLPPSDAPLILVRASTLGMRTEARRLLGEGSVEVTPQPLEERCFPPPPGRRESIVALFDARTGARLAAAAVREREALALAQLEAAPELAVTARTPSPTPLPESPLRSYPIQASPAGTRPTPRPTVDAAALPSPMRETVSLLGLAKGRWWRYDSDNRTNGYHWSHSVITATISEMWQDGDGTITAIVRSCIAGPSFGGMEVNASVYGIDLWEDGCNAYYPFERIVIQPDGQLRHVSIDGPPNMDLTFPFQGGPLPPDTDPRGVVRSPEGIVVPAGEFRGCRVLERAGADGSAEWWWLCPGEGLVRKESFTCSRTGQENEVTEMAASGTSERHVFHYP